MSLADDLHAFLNRHRGAHPHVHRCTECYEDEACGLDCTTDEDDDRPVILRGGHVVCSACKRAIDKANAAPRPTRAGHREE